MEIETLSSEEISMLEPLSWDWRSLIPHELTWSLIFIFCPLLILCHFLSPLRHISTFPLDTLPFISLCPLFLYFSSLILLSSSVDFLMGWAFYLDLRYFIPPRCTPLFVIFPIQILSSCVRWTCLFMLLFCYWFFFFRNYNREKWFVIWRLYGYM